MKTILTIILASFFLNQSYAQDLLNLIEDKRAYKITSIYFAGGRYYIDDEQMQKAVDFLNSNILENYEIHIHSHTDNVGSLEYNQWLSRMRSMATKMMLEDSGIPTENIFIKDHGLNNPEFNNESYMGRMKNRRVDIVLWPLPA